MRRGGGVPLKSEKSDHNGSLSQGENTLELKPVWNVKTETSDILFSFFFLFDAVKSHSDFTWQ